MAKASIHPNYQLATITCACGATYETASTRGSFAVEICAHCHPFYTGKQKLNDSAGRIERFQRRYQLKPGASLSVEAEAKPKKAEAEAKPKAEKPEKGGEKGEKKADDKGAKPAKPKKDGEKAAQP